MKKVVMVGAVLSLIMGLPVVSFGNLLELKCVGDDFYYTVSSELPVGGSRYQGELTLVINTETNTLTKIISQKGSYSDVEYTTTDTHYAWKVDFKVPYVVKNGENIGETGNLNRYTGEIKINYISNFKGKKGKVVNTFSTSFDGMCEQTTKKF